MRKISGSIVTVVGLTTNVLKDTALSTIVRSIPVEFRAALIDSGDEASYLMPAVGYSLLKLGTNDLSRQWLPVYPGKVLQRPTTGNTPVAGALGYRAGLTDDDILFNGELVIEEIGSLLLQFGSTVAGETVIWEALYR